MFSICIQYLFIIYLFLSKGTSANDTHFQAYLLEGVLRWNYDRAAAATESDGPSHTSYASAKEILVNQKCQQLYGQPINTTLVAPLQYTGRNRHFNYVHNTFRPVEYIYTQVLTMWGVWASFQFKYLVSL